MQTAIATNAPEGFAHVNVFFYIGGVVVIVIAKVFLHNKHDDVIEKFKRIFEIPADLCFLGFMMGIAGTAQVEHYTRELQLVLLSVIAISMLSVVCYKQCSSYLSTIGGSLQIEKSGRCISLFLLNCVLALSCLYLSYNYLGANL